jgi:hypothetical protein
MGSLQLAQRRCAEFRPSTRLLKTPQEQRKGLVLAALDMSQAIDRLLVGRIAHELVSADPFDQHDLACLNDLQESRLHRLNGTGVIANPRLGIGLFPSPYRSTLKASDGLGVESPIGRLGILLLANAAQREGL